MPALIYVGDTTAGTTSEMRLRALADLGYQVVPVGHHLPADLRGVAELAIKVSYKLRRPLDLAGVNAAILGTVAAASPELLWIDKGIAIRPHTLRAVKRQHPAIQIVGFSPDDMVARHNNTVFFLECLPLYDAFITTKSYGVAELQALGCPRVAFVDNSYDPATHRPMPPEDPSTARFACDVGFIGHFEAERAAMIDSMAAAGIPVTIRGNGWHAWRRRATSAVAFGPAVIGDDYARAISATRINLGFLRRINRDLQTTRSVEIPACGGFMLAERSPEHARLFAEAEEAEYFSGVEELHTKIHRYLADEPVRRAIAAAGRQRCLRDDYSYAGRLRKALAALGIPRPHEGDDAGP
jgi:spore maturation protein CgeB